MALSPATRLGPYEVTAKLGAGGMGEVYRATDTHLKRQVAIKVLPVAVAADADRLARFQREAEVLAALNHPNIAGIYGLEKTPEFTALVMELVEGEDLSEVIARGPIAWPDALPIARQIAEALEAAHEQGIIHRDLKPANVKLRPDGTVKVLDFGLAKAMEPVGAASGAVSASMSPTITTPAMTQMGMILGTAAYMAPEQAKGRAVDARADVWAFGAVLFEMLSGQRAFDGEDTTDVLGAVVRMDPDWNLLPRTVPERVRKALSLCLVKDPKQRLSAIHDVRLALDGAFETTAPETTAPVATRPGWRQLLPVGAAAVAVTLLLTALAAWTLWPAPESGRVRRFPLTLPSSQVLPPSAGTLVALSPDGQTLVYRVGGSGGLRLYQQRFDSTEAVPIPGTEGAGETPFFSPDGRWLAFTQNNALFRVQLAGGQPVRIGDVGDVRGGSWGPDDTLVLGLRSSGLGRMSISGGSLTELATPQDGRQWWYPQILPDGRAVLFTSSTAGPDSGDVLVLDLETADAEPRVVVPGGSAGWYTPTGHLVFLRGGDLWAVAFDVEARATRGEPQLVETGIRVEGGGAVQFSVADDGSLAYVPGGTGSLDTTLVWVDRQGQEEAIDAPPHTYTYPRLSPDGNRVAVATASGEGDIFVWDFVREVATNVTASDAYENYVLWTRDGTRLITSSNADGPRHLYWLAADGAGTPQPLTADADPGEQYPEAVTPDGERLVYRKQRATGGFVLRIVSLTGEPAPDDLLSTDDAERNAEVSPNGRWMAYQSNRSGQDEIYVSPFPAAATRQWSISAGGGTRPVWAPDGRELFYVVEGTGRLMAVTVDPDADALVAGRPAEVLDVSGYLFNPPGRTYDVGPDGRFLFVKTAAQQTGEDTPAPQIIVVQHWFEELKRLVPTE